ncbi:unnamed protein product [Caenorhabditis brenneri]
MDEKKIKLEENFLEDLEEEEEETEFYEALDPTEPSTSNAYQDVPEKFHYAPEPVEIAVVSSGTTSPSTSLQRNRLRGNRNSSAKAIAEAAKNNGMQTVDRSGAKFVIPITVQAHPTQLNDRVLNEKDDILSQTEALPYCCHCNSVIKTWRGFEYHVLKIHLKYRPYRCFHCQKESFYTEEEGRFHSSTVHPSEDVELVKQYTVAKETAAKEAFQNIFMMCRDGPKVTREVVFQWEQEAFQQVMKFHYLRFKRPIILTKKLPVRSREQQTEVSALRLMIQPILPHDQQTEPIFPPNISLNDHRLVTIPGVQPGSSPAAESSSGIDPTEIHRYTS